LQNSRNVTESIRGIWWQIDCRNRTEYFLTI